MEAGGGWCSAAITVPLLNEASLLATGRRHGRLKLVAFVQKFKKLLSFIFELIRGSVGALPQSAFSNSSLLALLLEVLSPVCCCRASRRGFRRFSWLARVTVSQRL